jgi:hypothetical protein
MTDNEVISEWRGECRHKGVYKKSKNAIQCECGGSYKDGHEWHWHLENVIGRGASESKILTRLDYDKNPAAWTPELFQKIKEAGLKSRFLHALIGARYRQIEGRVFTENGTWWVASSTPEQKAAALSKAIREG